MLTRGTVLNLLADGRFHSGSELGAAFGVSRAAINKTIKSLLELGLDIHRVSGRGYRLVDPLSPLSREIILMDSHSVLTPDRLHLLEETDSTSAHLERLKQKQDISGHVACTEIQLGGRGRRGRSWVSTPYRSILFSLAKTIELTPVALSGLSLAAGVALVRSLRKHGVGGVGLKWPNDLVAKDRKLGGILIDMHGEATGPCQIILGVGLNIDLSESDGDCIDQPWTDVARLTGKPLDRSRLLGSMIYELFSMLDVFGTDGFSAFRDQWTEYHCYQNQRVRLLHGQGEVTGIAQGVDDYGALVIADEHGNEKLFHAGEVSLRINR